MPLRPELQEIVDTLLAAGADGLSLDELADALGTKMVSYDEVDQMIDQLERGGVEVRSPEAVDLPAELRQVLTAARTLTAELGHHPSAQEIAERSGLTAAAVHRALIYGRVLSR